MIIPVDARRQDWPRLVSQANAALTRRVETLETGGGISRAKLRFVGG